MFLLLDQGRGSKTDDPNNLVNIFCNSQSVKLGGVFVICSFIRLALLLRVSNIEWGSTSEPVPFYAMLMFQIYTFVFSERKKQLKRMFYFINVDEYLMIQVLSDSQ